MRKTCSTSMKNILWVNDSQSIPSSPCSHCWNGYYAWAAIFFILTMVTAFSYVIYKIMIKFQNMFNQPIFCDLRLSMNHMHTKCPYKTVLIYCKIVLYRFELKKQKEWTVRPTSELYKHKSEYLCFNTLFSVFSCFLKRGGK